MYGVFTFHRTAPMQMIGSSNISCMPARRGCYLRSLYVPVIMYFIIIIIIIIIILTPSNAV
jgi:hypothetical protein